MREGPRWLTPDLINKMRDLSTSNRSRQEYLKNAKRFYEWYRAKSFLAPLDEFDDMTISDRQATARRNVIGETVDEMSSLFLKNKPVVRRWPYLARNAALSDDLDAMSLFEWDMAHGHSVFRSLMEDAQITGLGTAKILWSPKAVAFDRQGRVMMETLTPGTVYVDPRASNQLRGTDARFILHIMWKPEDELVARYGKDAAIALGWPSQRRGKKRWWDSMADAMSGYDREETARLSPKGDGGDEREGGSQEDLTPLAEVVEAWIFPQSIYVGELTTGDDVMISEYPYGLVATMIEDKIVRVRSNPFRKSRRLSLPNEYGTEVERRVQVGHGRHPFVHLWWKRISDLQGNRRFYDCMGMVEWAILMQFNLNALRRNIAQNSRTISNPPIAAQEDALDMPLSDLTLPPNQIIRVRAGRRLDEAIKILQPGAMPAQVFDLVRADMEAIKAQAGLKMGVTSLFPEPAGGTSHTPPATFGTLQEAAFTPLWRYVEEIGYSLSDIFRLVDGLIQLKCRAGSYLATTRRGIQTQVEWTGQHAAAQFRYEVVAGATTPLYDLEKQTRGAQIVEITNAALDSGDPRKLRTAIIYLRDLNFPWAQEYIQVLEEEQERLNQMGQGLMQFGAQQLMQGAPGGPGAQSPLALQAPQGGAPPQQGGIPAQQGQMDTSGLQSLADELGVDQATLMQRLALQATG